VLTFVGTDDNINLAPPSGAPDLDKTEQQEPKCERYDFIKDHIARQRIF
jgi:hypothetical protein